MPETPPLGRQASSVSSVSRWVTHWLSRRGGGRVPIISQTTRPTPSQWQREGALRHTQSRRRRVHRHHSVALRRRWCLTEKVRQTDMYST